MKSRPTFEPHTSDKAGEPTALLTEINENVKHHKLSDFTYIKKRILLSTATTEPGELEDQQPLRDRIKPRLLPINNNVHTPYL